MITVELIHNNSNLVKFKVYGHSGYDISGRDIVCAAVSTITQSVIVGLEKVICKDFHYEIDEEKPMVYVDISMYSDENMRMAQIILKTFKYTLQELVVDYGKYIKIMIKEDNNDEI